MSKQTCARIFRARHFHFLRAGANQARTESRSFRPLFWGLSLSVGKFCLWSLPLSSALFCFGLSFFNLHTSREVCLAWKPMKAKGVKLEWIAHGARLNLGRTMPEHVGRWGARWPLCDWLRRHWIKFIWKRQAKSPKTKVRPPSPPLVRTQPDFPFGRQQKLDHCFDF